MPIPITTEQLRQILNYNPETGEFFWRVGGRGWRAGSVAGTIRSDGYVKITIGGQRYYAHRLAWLYMYGEVSAATIDHIDMNPSNNKISNLRQATHSENKWNTRKRRDNTSGFKGVRWHQVHKKWYARITYLGKEFFIGHFDTAEQASTAYNDKARELFGEFYRNPSNGNANSMDAA